MSVLLAPADEQRPPRPRARFGRHRTLAALVATVATTTLLVPAAALASAPPASTTTAGRPSWAGYQAGGRTFSRVSASWTVPALTCRGTTPAGDPDSYFWVGLGSGSSSAERVGVRELCAGTLSAVVAYLEMNGRYEVQGIDPSAGDSVTASVRYASGAYTFSLADSTQNRSFSVGYRCGAFSFGQGTCSRATAQVGAGIWAAGTSPLADYGAATFSGVRITDGTGFSGSLASPGHWKVSKYSEYDGGAVAASPSALASGGTRFTDTWRHL